METADGSGGFLIGVDIGGTCTDVAMINSKTKQQFFFKTETTPRDVEQGVVNGVAGILEATEPPVRRVPGVHSRHDAGTERRADA